MAVLPIAFAACQEEVMVEEYPLDSAVHTISCSIGGEQVEGRAQIVLGNKNRENEIFHWNAGDQFTLFGVWSQMTENDGLTYRYETYPYSIDDTYDDNQPTNTANFSYTGEWNSYVTDWVAFYPTTSVDEDITKTDNFCSLTIANTIPDNDEHSWKDYFKDNMYMMTYGAKSDLSSGIYFSHLCGIVRITYTNATETDHELKGIYVDGTLGNKQEYDLSQPDLLSDWGTSNMHGLTFTDKATVAAGASEDFYILFFPPQAPEGTELQNMKGIKVDYGVDETSSMSQTPTQYFGKDFDYSGFMAGKCYWFRITGLENGKIVWTKDHNSGNNEEDEQPGGDDIELDEATQNFYNDLNNPNINEIILNEPITLSSGVDLGGKTISLAENFFTNNSDALAAIKFINNNSDAQYGFENGTIKGSSTETGKYLIESNIYCLQLCRNLSLVASGNLNGVHVTDKRCYLSENVSITTAEEGHAIKMLSNEGSFKLAMWDNVTVSDVHLECNYVPSTEDTDKYNSFIHLYKQDRDNKGYDYARINGDVVITGSQASIVQVLLGDGEEGLNLISGEIYRSISSDEESIK